MKTHQVSGQMHYKSLHAFFPIQKCQTVRQISNRDKCQNVGSASHHFFVIDANFTEVDESLKSQTVLRESLDQGHRGRSANPVPSKQRQEDIVIWR